MSAKLTGKGLIPISAARSISEWFNAPVVVIYAVHPDRQNFTVTTYGETKKLCKLAAAYGKNLAEAVWGVALQVQEEPTDAPADPAHFAGTLSAPERPAGEVPHA